MVPSPDDSCSMSCELKDCIKDLDFSTISFMIANPDASFDELMQDVTNRVPVCFSDPEHTCARVTIGSTTIQTTDYGHCAWRLDAPVMAGGKSVGTLEVGYLGMTADDASPFTEDDTLLLKAMADRIGIIAHSNSMKNALQQSEKKYRTLIDNALVGITQSTLDGRLLYANATGLRMFGFESIEEGMATSPLSRYRNPNDRQAMLKALTETGSVTNLEVEMITKTGDPMFVLFSATLERDIITGMMMDVTHRKQAEKELMAKSLKLEEVNTALKVLLERREQDKLDIEDKVIFTIRKLILPYIETLKQKQLNEEQMTYLEILEANLNNIISPFAKRLTSVQSNFTPQEIKVADFIRNGKTVKEISTLLGVTDAAINRHRQSIRNKLGLNNQKMNLRTYLLSLT